MMCVCLLDNGVLGEEEGVGREGGGGKIELHIIGVFCGYD